MPGSTVSTPSEGQASTRPFRRRLPIGAEYASGRAYFRVWAPVAHRVDVVSGAAQLTLEREEDGYFSGAIEATPGTLYQFRIDEAEPLYPDPASRFQPEGPHGPSAIIDPAAFEWTDSAWRGATMAGQVVYEMHVGTFTREGTWEAAAREIDELARLGITMIEVMPVADFNGKFGWGYDGVNLFAPTRLYGRPDDFRRFVDRAHGSGIAVILDVVYNHFGPVGNYLRVFSPAYFTDKYPNEWGDAINFDGPGAAGAREFFTVNSGYWIDEFHLDGLRLDATQQMYDNSDDHILRSISRRAREAAGGRDIVLIAENESQNTRLVRPLDQGGYGLDALWNDDFHHSAMVALTGRAEAYYSDTRGDPQEFISAAKYGYLFQGQPYHWQRKPRGTPSWGLQGDNFVTFLENHDQIANSAHGRRGHELTSPGRWRAMTALLFLMPGIPLLFQGQEFCASTPFLYFADLDTELARVVRKGRREFLSQFPSIVDFCRTGNLADPADHATFARCVLDLNERQTHASAYKLHHDLLTLRKSDAAFRASRRGCVDGAVLSADAFVLRFFSDGHLDDRLLIVNLGRDLSRASFAEPLMAPPTPAHDWAARWSSENAEYGGRGTPAIRARETGDQAVRDAAGAECYLFGGESAIVLSPCRRAADTA